jgi:Cdc6-like AAA superfamily ATPase
MGGKYNPFRPDKIAPPGMFCGRMDELRFLDHCLLQTKNGNPQHFLIEGERGIGKSSLLLSEYVVATGKDTTFDGDQTLDFIVVEISLEPEDTYFSIIKKITQQLKLAVNEREKLKAYAFATIEFISRVEAYGVRLRHGKETEDSELFANLQADLVHLIQRIKEAWSQEHVRWSKRDLSAKRYVYFWADGIHVQARLEDAAQCLLVIIGATPEGKKELVGLIDGVRESAQSWKELLLDLKRRGLAIGPELAIADGALGFWQAIEEVWPKTCGQRCWVHKTANVLNKLPKSQQPKAKRALKEIWMAETKRDALVAFDAFVETWGVKYDKAVACLIKDRDALLAFYDFPAEHWKHLRTTNVIESAFATVRHRTVRAKGCLSNKTALAMVFKLAEAAERSWRRLNGHKQLPKIILGVRFANGIEVVSSQAQAAAA